MSHLNTWKGAKPSARAVMGWGGIALEDDSVDMLDMLRAYMTRAAQESCGQCFPCRSGLKNIVARLTQICDGIGQEDDVEYLKQIAICVQKSSRCDIGQTSPQPLLDIIAHAPQQLQARKVESKSYVSVVTAPCVNACPGHVDVPTYIEKIRLRQYEASFNTIMQRCPMPGTIGRVCERPCETACKRGLNGAPVAIRHLKRFVADRCFDKKQATSTSANLQNKAATESNQTKKIAIVGAGPAGLACAYHLLTHNFVAHIFEKQESAGGMAKFGIPDYRLPPPVLESEVELIESLGGKIHYGVEIGKDKTIAQLEQDGYKVVFIGTGAPNAPGMRIEGEDAAPANYVSGIEYLGEAARGKQIVHGKRLVVVGGGNVAMDCVRTALRHGFSDVHIMYRRTEQEMPADKTEIHEAKLEGVIFNFLVAPLRVVHENGKVTGLECQKMRLGEPDASGRRSPEPIEGSSFIMDVDVIIHAIGQKAAVESVLTGLSGGLSKYKTLDAHDVTGNVTELHQLFGGGDCVTGPSSLIAALAAGRRAALHMISYLKDGKTEMQSNEWAENAILDTDIMSKDESIPTVDPTDIMPVHALSVDKRLSSFAEVEHGSADWEAITEAKRCLRCFRILTMVP